MSDINSYLTKHFLPDYAFAARGGVSLTQLHEFITAGLLPEPSYVVEAGSIKSFVFGAMPAPDAKDSAYFHPKTLTWLAQAMQVRDAAHLQANFQKKFAAALAELNASTWRLTDSFDDSGGTISAGLETRLASAWQHFLRGTFGLCVADPSSESSIARKEILQEKLTFLTNNGADPQHQQWPRADLLQLIEDYAQAAMPFSPIEYARSSRKRLVQDLLEKLNYL